MNIKPVILCGGSGTRLWPLSTPEMPKQFQALTGSSTMIALTAERLHTVKRDDLEIGRTLVVGSKKHELLLRKQLPNADLILEPFGRNSAPAVAAACLASEADDLILILPADHHIEKPEQFLKAIAVGQLAAADGAIVTFGVKPTHPATDYGYILADEDDSPLQVVSNFVEKPCRDRAIEYVSSGRYYWNAGIFLFKASVMKRAFEAHAPEILATMRTLIGDKREGCWSLDPATFESVNDISIDYAIMERETNIQMVPVDMGWSDVGGYEALWEMYAASEKDTVTFGPAITQETERLFVRTDHPLVCVSGVSDLAIVANADVVMIAPLADPAAIKALGKAAQQNTKSINISSQTAKRANDLLWEVLSHWQNVAWDKENGGFFESLNMDGSPDRLADRRVRVQARQVFSFASAISLGAPNPDISASLVMDGLDYLQTKCRHDGGGWAHRVSAKGEIVDPTRDLYDHAFIMLAGASAYQATSDLRALEMALEALDFIDRKLVDPKSGGYFEGVPCTAPRRANPHMHLLEAFLALYGATGDRTYLDRATKIVSLFERKFFDYDANILREFFNDTWNPDSGEKGRLFEPGHHYEWSSLLALYDHEVGRGTISWRRRLIKTADELGVDSSTRLAFNVVLANGKVVDSRHRIWHQLEMFRARMLHPGTAPPGDADRILENVISEYFDPMPRGTWLDEKDSSGKPTSTTIPGSILYHLITALSPALRSD